MKEVVMRKEYDDEDEIPERRHSSGKKKKKFGWVNVLTILLVVVLVVLVGVYAVINHYYSKSNYVSDDKITINKSTEVETESTGLTDEETDALQSEILNETQDIELPNNNNVYNILLIGVDRRDKKPRHRNADRYLEEGERAFLAVLALADRQRGHDKVENNEYHAARARKYAAEHNDVYV